MTCNAREPLVSVIIPVYNVERYLHGCIDSVLNQTYKNLEIIIVDDGSTDDCPGICDDYAGKDARVTVIHKPNGGLSDARNTGFRAASGEYIYFIDSDDYVISTAMEECVIIAENGQAEFVFFDRILVYEDEKGFAYEKPRLRKRAYEANAGYKVLAQLMAAGEYTGCVPYTFTRSDYIRKHNLSFYDGIIHEDDLYTFLLFLYAQKAVHINRPFYYARRRPGSTMTGPHSSKHFFGYCTVCLEIMKLYNSNEFTAEVNTVICEYLIYIYKLCMNSYIKLSSEERSEADEERKKLCKGIKAAKYLNSFTVRVYSNHIILGGYKKLRKVLRRRPQ